MKERLGHGIGAVPAWLLRALRLARRPRPLWEPPWAGAYRTRPVVEREPVRKLPSPPSPRRSALGHGLMSAAFVAAGVINARHARDPEDRLYGFVTVIFFGMCLWVFVEQMIHGVLVLPPSAGRRLIALLGLAGGALVYVGASEAAAPIVHRAGTALGGVFLIGVTVWVSWRLLRARGRPG